MLTEGLFTVPEAAAQTRLSYWTIWDLLKKGRLLRTKVAGRTFIRESELKKLIVDHANPKAEPRSKRKAAVAQ